MIRLSALLLVLASLSSGCVSYRSHVGRGVKMQNAELLYPVVAVQEFENRANFNGQWNLGSGFADLLVTRLLQSKEAVVLERKHLRDVTGEINRQQHSSFRQEGRADYGRLKNTEYLIRGTITDFTVTGDVTGWFSAPAAKGRARSSSARVALNVKIVDVETGDIIASVEESGSATAGMFGGAVNYKGVAFGGRSYFRTPLGKATHSAMRKAVNQILKALPRKKWQARVADVLEGNIIIINGGANVNLKPGERFEIRGPEKTITDPVTGNIIRRLPGQRNGEIEVTEIFDQSANARIIEGTTTRGDLLRSLP
jgi:curli biogenesis system outer membrane secretion channel CsgG